MKRIGPAFVSFATSLLVLAGCGKTYTPPPAAPASSGPAAGPVATASPAGSRAEQANGELLKLPQPPARVKTMDELEQEVVKQFGPERTARVIIENVPGEMGSFFPDRIKAASSAQSFLTMPSGTTVTIVCGPVDNLQQLASALTFGELTGMDQATRSIRIKADKTKMPAPVLPAIEDPRDPNFYQQNLADLKGADVNRARDALRRLAKASPSQLRAEVVAAVKPFFNDQDHGAREAALQTYIAWEPGDKTETLLRFLKDDSGGIRERALAGLAESKDPRAIEPIAALLETDRGQAKKYLLRIGAPAQKAVAKHLPSRDEGVRNEALATLREIGAEDVTEEVCALLSDVDHGVRHRAMEVLEKSPSEAAIAPVAKLLLSERDRDRAADCLRKFGPMAEETVLKGLKVPDLEVVRRCCEILEKIGTKKSLPELQRLSRFREGSIRGPATNAGRAILARGR